MCFYGSDNPAICDDPDFDIKLLDHTVLYYFVFYFIPRAPNAVANNNYDVWGHYDQHCRSLNYLLSDQYNVSTGDVRLATGSFDCYFNTTVCLPHPCPIVTVWKSPSCASLALLASNSTYNVSESQFLAWNPNIQGSCGGVSNGQRVCLGAPGGAWPSPSATIMAPTGTGAYYTTATPAYPTQKGTTDSCGKYYKVVSGDNCWTVDLRFGINFTQLQSLNTYLNDNCTTLWLNYDWESPAPGADLATAVQPASARMTAARLVTAP
ncbi:hypothetical protein PMAA_036450 [Paecilomyces variotii No. 5]|uniref:LysM domain-containing protein n=1 Tax=Byssochlamys spectabilis (strain No. 5 / NBRC 109023) TaxID=1356009 RepID=V5G1S5_BYSSN|nr:hypothetical protein PMAA_036450 [Paecilomyces variotii No. 5]